MSGHLLEVNHLRVDYGTKKAPITVVNDVSFYVDDGEIVGLVGESGCGKSMTARAIMGMISKPGRIVNGVISFENKPITDLSKAEYQKLRGKDISMIFQEPMTSLNPVYTVGAQMVETIMEHLSMSKKQSKEHALSMLQKVGISIPEQRFNQYPGELSGGMRQRVMIGIALSCSPRLLIADEPTTALDVTIQAQILDLMQTLCTNNQMSTIVVTHDLGVVSELCNRVIVMYSGEIVEIARVREILDYPVHPYTKALMKAIPRIGQKKDKLYSIPGTVLSPSIQTIGCRFADRCELCSEKCLNKKPLMQERKGHSVKCWNCNFPLQ